MIAVPGTGLFAPWVRSRGEPPRRGAWHGVFRDPVERHLRSGAAGEAGRGFAVVAEEVRSLAMRSKEAATKTEALISESVKQATEGETTAQHVSAKLAEIAGGVAKVTEIVAEIAASPGAERGHRAGEQGRGRDGQGDAAERGQLRGVVLGGGRALGQSEELASMAVVPARPRFFSAYGRITCQRRARLRAPGRGKKVNGATATGHPPPSGGPHPLDRVEPPWREGCVWPHPGVLAMFEKVKVGTKVIAGFCLGIAITAAVGLVALRSAGQVGERLEDIAAAKVPSLHALAVLSEAQTSAARGINLLMLRRADADMRKSARADIEGAFGHVDEARKAYEALPHGAEALRLWAAVEAPLKAWQQAFQAAMVQLDERERLITMPAATDPAARAAGEAQLKVVDDACWTAYVEVRRAFAPADRAVAAVLDQTGKDVAAGNEAGRGAVKAGRVVVLSALLVATLLMLALGVLLSRGIGRTLTALLGEATKLTGAVRSGKLAVRGDVTAVSFEFQPVIAGVNETMDAYAKPIAVTSEYLDRIARGDLPPAIADHYEGDFNGIKASLNGCIGAVQALVADAASLAQAGVEGKLRTRADAARHQGDFRRIVEGVNSTLDAVLGPIDEAAQVLDRLAQRDLRARVTGAYVGDHARIKEALNETAQALHDAMSQVAAGGDGGVVGLRPDRGVEPGGGLGRLGAGGLAGGDELVAGVDGLRHPPVGRQRAAGERAGPEREGGGDRGRRGHGPDERGDGQDQGVGRGHLADHQGHQRDRVPDQPARAQRGGGGGAGGRGGARASRWWRRRCARWRMRSKEAANKTEVLISDSVRQATEGELTAQHVSAKLAEIAGSVAKVTDIVAEIAASAREQSAGIQQVNKAVAQMDQVTQQNAANSEESSSAAAELSGQSEELAAMVQSFQLDRAAEAPRAAVARRLPALPASTAKGAMKRPEFATRAQA